MKEIAVVISHEGKDLFWLDGADSVSIPDNRNLWQFIWENRDKVYGVAHTHPGRGFPRPSTTDLSTFRAIEDALGRYLSWWIFSEDCYIIVRRYEPKDGTSDDYDLFEFEDVDPRVPSMMESVATKWISKLRQLSYGG